MAELEEQEQQLRRGLYVLQSMIEISADRLEDLRTKCSTSAELTQQEIRTLEGKLIKLYSKQLVTKSRLSGYSLPPEIRAYPSLDQWLRVVGLTPESIQIVCTKVGTLEALKEKSEHEISAMLGERNNSEHEEELRRLGRALHNLRRYTEVLLRGDESGEMNLFWDSWDRNQLKCGTSPRPIRSRVGRNSVSSEDSIQFHNNNFNYNNHSNNNSLSNERLEEVSSIICLGATPPPTPLMVTRELTVHEESDCSATPPSSERDRITVDNLICQSAEIFPLTKSKSHESQLANRLEGSETSSKNDGAPRRNRLSTEPGLFGGGIPSTNTSLITPCDNLISTSSTSPIKSPPPDYDDCSPMNGVLNNLQVPKSPRTPTVTSGMGHIIAHRFTKTFKMVTTCDYCDKQMFIGTGLKCKECKYKCHRDCESKVPPSCGLPQELFNEFKRTLQADGTGNQAPSILSKSNIITSPNHHSNILPSSLDRKYSKRSYPHSSINIPTFQGADSSSNTSSCNSSTPSSPALLPMGNHSVHQLPLIRQHHCQLQHEQQQHFHEERNERERARGIEEEQDKERTLTGDRHGDQQHNSKEHGEHGSIKQTFNDEVQHDDRAENTNNTDKGYEKSDRNDEKDKDEMEDFKNNLTRELQERRERGRSHEETRVELDSQKQELKQQFQFPEVTLNNQNLILVDKRKTQRLESCTTTSTESDKTLSASGSYSISTDSEKTPVRVDSQDSQVSDGEPSDNRWPRQNSLSMREWEIPYDELRIGDPIGTGRFGTVYRGNWHGDVAIKVLNMDYYADDDKTLEAFKLEVATFRKTRHENLVLFMGACMKQPHLAIVTSLSKGMTLYAHIHLRKDKFNMNKTTIIAQQISQGMGYLHARGIVHKDLKSKNIFLENGKVVITDFGLFSVTKLCYGNRKTNGLSIPPGWLCYLAPEIVRRLRPQQTRDQEELPFTEVSDVYAFGTVWYELLCGEWPFRGQPPEAMIWQVGKGIKQTLANLQASREVKDILMLCWSYHPANRPDFSKLLTTLEKLPRKRLARSPSHPIHLSRSAESVF